jgi:flagellar protein FliO/FliZ
LGGEKLKSSHRGVFFAAIFIVTGIFNIQFPLFAQTPSEEEQAAPSLSNYDESVIVLGENDTIPAPAGASSVIVMLRMVLVLALAALAIYGVVFFIKRLARPREGRDPHLKVLARVSLGGDSFAAVLSVGAKAWLVGGGSGAVNLISEIDDVESLETMLTEDSKRIAEAGTLINFRSLLSRFGVSLGGKMPPGSSQTESGSPVESQTLRESLRKQQERLKGL